MFGLYSILPQDKTKKKLTKLQNNLEFTNTFNQLINLALDIFEWKNLPETCDPRLMEAALLWRGYMAFYKDKSGNIWSYSAGPGGRLTKYGYPNEGYLYALNGEVAHCNLYWPFMDNTNADGVLCLDNKMGYPMINMIIRGAERIADARRALDIAAKNSKRPFIFVGTEEQTETIKSIYNDIDNNDPYLVLNEQTLDLMKPNILNTNFHEGVIKELWDYFINTRNDVLNSLGIMTKSNNDKKERMTQSESMGDVDYVNKQQDYRLEERKAFCERVNEAFGLNISVDYKQSVLDLMEQEAQIAQGGNDGNKENTKPADNRDK